MILKTIKFCILAIALYTIFINVNLKSNCYNNYNQKGYTKNALPAKYKNEADREGNDVHHHFEYPESSWKQQHQTPQVILDEGVLPSVGME